MSKGGGSGDGGAGCVIMLFIMAAILTIIAFLVGSYLSVMAGKFLNYAFRVVFGWTLSRSSNKKYLAFSTIAVLLLIPIGGWLILLATGFNLSYDGTGIVIIYCSTLALIGYYAAHFGSFSDSFGFLQAPGVMMIHEQENIWRNSIRTKGLIFWHWTIASKAIAIDSWFRTSISSLYGMMAG